MGKIVVTTGGNGTLGKSVVKKLIKEGYFVISLVHTLSDEKKVNILEVETDLSDINAIQRSIERVKLIISKIEIESLSIIHMAGIYEKQKFPVKIGDMQKWNEIFWVNTFSFYFIVSELVDLFKLIRRGNIIAVSSNLTKLVNNDTAAYIGAKAALEKITVQLAYQLGEYNICCNIICPGFFFSAMSNNIPLNVLEEIKKNTPLNQVVTEETIATVILDILCSKNLGMTGQIITVDGGNTIGFAKN